MTKSLPTNKPSSFNRKQFANFLKDKQVNYLHLGNALDVWSELLPDEDVTSQQIELLLAGLSRHADLRRVIASYRRSHKACGFNEIKRALNESKVWREQFQALGCRGFSYHLDVGMEGYSRQNSSPYHLSKDTNLRIALMSNRDLFYPSCVRRNLRLLPWASNHYFHGKAPSIAFSLGKKTKEAWYVLVLQSDVDSRASCMDDHFRGWRNVLFANIVARACGNAGAVYLSRAKDVAKACFPGTNKTGHVPQRWSCIYDGTAREWSMPLVEVTEPVNIQIHRCHGSVLTRHFYKLELPSCE